MLQQIVANEDTFVVACLSLVGIVAILVFGIGATIVSLFRLSIQSRLKQQMLDRGMSVAEIEQVLKAGMTEGKADQAKPPTRPQQGVHKGITPPSKPFG